MFINYCGDFNICPQIIWYTSLQEVEHNSLSVECRLELSELLPTEQEKIKNSNFTVDESGLNVSPSKSVWSPNPQFEGIKRWGLREVIRFRLGHDGRTLMKNQYPYKKKTIWAHSEKMEVYKPRRGSSPEPTCAGTLILNCQPLKLRK